jgi:hypothetical protein
MGVLIDLITGSLGPYLIAAAGGLIAIAGAYFKGRAAGKNKMLNEQRKADVEAYQKREEIDDQVDSDSDAAVRDRLRDDARG